MHLRTIALGLIAVVAMVTLLYLRSGPGATGSASPVPVPVPVASTPQAPRANAAPVRLAGDAQGDDLVASLISATPPPLPAPSQLPVTPDPLPPWDAQLVDVLPALRARADAGDAVAACHIGLALSACALQGNFGISPAQLRNLDPADEETLNRLAFQGEDLLRPGRERSCAGLGQNTFALRFKYLLRAAEQGNDAAALAFVDGMAFSTVEGWVRHPDLLEVYRARAPELVRQLVARGNQRMAILLWMNAHGWNYSLLPQVLDLDEGARATFFHLGGLVRHKPSADPGFGFSASVSEAGRQRAAQIYARYFSGKPYTEAESVGLRDPLRVEACAES